MIYIRQANTEAFAVGPVKFCNGDAVDLSEATVKMMIKRDINDRDDMAVLAKEIINPDSNIVLFNLTADETLTIPEGQYIMGVKIFFNDHIQREIFSDLITIERGVFNE